MPDVNTWTDVTCPSACGGTLNYGALPSDPNCVSVPPLSEISDIYIQPTGATAPFDWTTPTAPTAVSGAIDNTTTDNSKTKHLVVVGNQGDPEETIYNGPKGTTVVGLRRYTIEGRTPITAQSIYDFLKQIQCNNLNFVFWFGTRGGYLFGGATGINPASSNARFPKEEGNEGYENGIIILEYETDNGDPPRVPNPLAT